MAKINNTPLLFSVAPELLSQFYTALAALEKELGDPQNQVSEFLDADYNSDDLCYLTIKSDTGLAFFLCFQLFLHFLLNKLLIQLKVQTFERDFLSWSTEVILGQVNVDLGPGTVLLLDNWRVTHSRSAYTGHR